MRRKKHTTGMLFICAVLLGAFIWFIERNSENSQQRQQRNRTLFAVHPQSIRLIRLERGDTVIECSKTAGKWKMSLPTDAPVNSSMIEKMIAGMSAVERGALITGETMANRGMSPSDYGFDAPRARITFQNDRGTFIWLIGRDAPLGETLYVMAAGGSDVISTDKTLLNLVPEDAAWIRDHTLFGTKAAAVRGIDLRRAAGFLRLRQEQENNWRMEQPHTGPTDLPSMNALIEQILSAQILEFITEEKSDLTVYGLNEPSTELTLFTEDEQTQTLLIGKAPPGKPEALYAKWADRDAVFTVPAEWAAGFEMDCNQLRSRQIIHLPVDSITSVKISLGEIQTRLVRTNGTWIVSRPARWDAEPAAVHTLLNLAAAPLINSFVDNPTEAQRKQIQTAPWVITVGSGSSEQTLRIAVNEDGSRLVQRNDETSLFTTAPGALPDTLADPLFYRSRTVMKIDPASISALALQTAELDSRVEVKDGEYVATDQARKPDRSALLELTTALDALRTGRYIEFNPDSLTPYGLDTPSARLKISLTNTNLLGQVILLGAPAEKGRFAMVQGENVVFVLPEKTADILTRELTQPIENNRPENEHL